MHALTVLMLLQQHRSERVQCLSDFYVVVYFSETLESNILCLTAADVVEKVFMENTNNCETSLTTGKSFPETGQ